MGLLVVSVIDFQWRAAWELKSPPLQKFMSKFLLHLRHLMSALTAQYQ